LDASGNRNLVAGLFVAATLLGGLGCTGVVGAAVMVFYVSMGPNDELTVPGEATVRVEKSNNDEGRSTVNVAPAAAAPSPAPDAVVPAPVPIKAPAQPRNSAPSAPAPSPALTAPAPAPEVPSPSVRPSAPPPSPEPIVPVPAPAVELPLPPMEAATLAEPVEETPAPDDALAMAEPGEDEGTQEAVEAAPKENLEEQLALEAQCPLDRGVEMKAMIGQLSDDTVDCIQQRYESAVLLTTRDKLSRVLIANAFGRGNTTLWERNVARHLKEVGQSDPDMCYKYASHLHKNAKGRSSEVVYWANRALENRHVWTGDGHVSRVYALHKMRTLAALNAWEQAGERFAASPSTASQRVEELARIETKTYAREWIDYAAEAGRDTVPAISLCVSATGDAEFCSIR
jgi:hypothetical protein